MGESPSARTQRELADLRRQIDDDVDALVERAKSDVDPRNLLRRQPVAAFGALGSVAALAGVTIAIRSGRPVAAPPTPSSSASPSGSVVASTSSRAALASGSASSCGARSRTSRMGNADPRKRCGARAWRRSPLPRPRSPSASPAGWPAMIRGMASPASSGVRRR